MLRRSNCNPSTLTIFGAAMNLQSVVNDFKSRVDTLAAQGQEVAKVFPDTVKQANEILLNGVQTLVKTETETAKDIFAAAKAGFDKAKTDGIKAVVANPIDYLPPKDKFITAFNDTVTLVSKTGDELYQTFKSGLLPIKSEAKKAVKTASKKVKTGAKKVAAKPAE
jgi:hypothetical protein